MTDDMNSNLHICKIHDSLCHSLFGCWQGDLICLAKVWSCSLLFNRLISPLVEMNVEPAVSARWLGQHYRIAPTQFVLVGVTVLRMLQQMSRQLAGLAMILWHVPHGSRNAQLWADRTAAPQLWHAVSRAMLTLSRMQAFAWHHLRRSRRNQLMPCTVSAVCPLRSYVV